MPAAAFITHAALCLAILPVIYTPPPIPEIPVGFRLDSGNSSWIPVGFRNSMWIPEFHVDSGLIPVGFRNSMWILVGFWLDSRILGGFQVNSGWISELYLQVQVHFLTVFYINKVIGFYLFIYMLISNFPRWFINKIYLYIYHLFYTYSTVPILQNTLWYKKK